MKMKATVPQAVFDTKEARRIQTNGHKQACEELDRTPRHLLGEGNPNHPIYNNTIFGYDAKAFMSRQYK